MPAPTDPLDARTAAGYFIGGMSQMNDTPPEVERMLREKFMARSGEERFVMGALMFDSAREMVKASLPRGIIRGGTATAVV